MPELFPNDGKNKYRFFAILLVLGQFLFLIPALSGFEIFYLYGAWFIGAWIVYKLAPDNPEQD